MDEKLWLSVAFFSADLLSQEQKTSGSHHFSLQTCTQCEKNLILRVEHYALEAIVHKDYKV